MTEYDSRGAYLFSYCAYDVVNPIVVDAQASRQCPHYKPLGLNPPKVARGEQSYPEVE